MFWWIMVFFLVAEILAWYFTLDVSDVVAKVFKHSRKEAVWESCDIRITDLGKPASFVQTYI